MQHAGSLLLQPRVGSLAVARELSCPGTCGIPIPRPGIKPRSPALEGGFLTTGSPGKSLKSIILKGSFNQGKGKNGLKGKERMTPCKHPLSGDVRKRCWILSSDNEDASHPPLRSWQVMDSTQSPKPPRAQSRPKPPLSPELQLIPAPFFNLQETLECDFPTKHDLRFCLLLRTPRSGPGTRTQHTLA